jgi:hypothetical protein
MTPPLKTYGWQSDAFGVTITASADRAAACCKPTPTPTPGIVPYTLTAPERAALRLSRTAVPATAPDEPIEPTPILAGELMEIDWPALTLFRFATPNEGRPVIIDIPRHLCTPAVRGRLYDLLVAVEREEVNRAPRCDAGPVMALLPRDA